MKNSILMMCATLAVVALTACSGADSGTIKMATGGTTGTYYSYSGVVAQTVSEQLDKISINVHSSGASKANIFEIVDGEADMAIVQNDVAYYAYNGVDLFADEGEVKDFSVLGGAYAEVCQVVSGKDITSIEDLRGKKVSIGDAGSGVEFNAHQILEAYGITQSDIQVSNLSFAESAAALKDGNIDAFFCVAGAPTTAIVELATTNEINVLDVEADKAEILREKYPFYTDYIIPAGTYKGVDKDVKSVAVKATFVVSNKLSADTVYDITKAIYENKDIIAHDKASELDAAYAIDGISIPFHSGAEKYFREVGVLK